MSNLNATRIKICGITNADDALAAVEFGANALGFIFVPDTPRYIGDRAPQILAQLPPFISTVAVCADLNGAPPPTSDVPDFNTVQYYAARNDHGTPSTSRTRVAAFRVKDEGSLEEIAQQIAVSRPHALLLDAYHPHKLGGAGVTFNWDLAVEAKRRFGLPVVLAGGLTPDNVGEAIRAVRPYAVDVASGVEAEPGRKDHARLRAFIRAVHATERL